jgi:hypothetical protein
MELPLKKITVSSSMFSSEHGDDINYCVGTELFFPAKEDIRKLLAQDPTLMLDLYHQLTCLSIAKGITYGDSWRKHGLRFSMIPNCLRKVDRVVNGAENNIIEPMIDGSGDCINYFALLLQYLREKHPDMYQHWMDTEVKAYIQQYCSEKAATSRIK